MLRFLIAPIASLLICFPALAQTLPSPVFGNTAPVANNNTALTAYKVVGGPPSVQRLGYATKGDGPVTIYNAVNTACSLNAGAGDGGSQVPSVDGKCWVAALPQPADLRVWGALCASGDMTARIQAALAVNVPLRAPSCTINVNGTVTILSPNASIVGDGVLSTFNSTSASANLFVINAANVQFKGVNFSASVTKTNGSYIQLLGANYFVIDNFAMTGWNRAIEVAGVAIIGPTISNGRIEQPASTSSIGIDYNGSGASVVSLVEHVLCTGTVSIKPSACVRVRNVGDLTLRGLSTVYGGTSITIDPQPGQGVQALLMSDSWIDTGGGTAGIFTAPASGTAVQLIRIADSWIATHPIGVYIASTGGDINEVDIDNSTIANNTSHGILGNTALAKNLRVRNSTIAGNGGWGYVSTSSVTDVSFSNNVIGATGQFPGNVSGGIALGASAADTNINNNVLLGNTGPALAYSTTGANVMIANNIGVNAAVSTGTVCASPCTVTAGPRPSTYYFTQSSTNTATVSLGGNVIGTMSSPNFPVTVSLQPGESAVVAWSTTAPTYSLSEQ